MKAARACLLALLLVAGCGNEERDDLEGKGRIWISNQGSSVITRFDGATALASEVVPTRQIRGDLTRLAQPGLLTYDSVEDRLYVPSTGSNAILIFDNFRQAEENIPPRRILQGLNTQLDRPVQVHLDKERDLLYVANSGSGSITVFPSASSVDGAVAPLRVLRGPDTRLTNLSSFEIDLARDQLWVSSLSNNAILIFDQASSLNGNVPPVRQLSGNNTRLQAPQYLLRHQDNLWVACSGALLRFRGLDGLAGDIAPEAVLTGQATGLSRPRQFLFHPENDDLYVIDSATQALLVFPEATTANGGPPPVRRLQGALTGLSEPIGLILDLSEP